MRMVRSSIPQALNLGSPATRARGRREGVTAKETQCFFLENRRNEGPFSRKSLLIRELEKGRMVLSGITAEGRARGSGLHKPERGKCFVMAPAVDGGGRSWGQPEVPSCLRCLDGATARSKMDELISLGPLPIFGNTETSKFWKPLIEHGNQEVERWRCLSSGPAG